MMFTFLIPFASVLIGAVIALYFKPKTPQGMKLILSFSGAFLLAILLLDMLPHIYADGDHQVGIWMLLGIISQNLLEFFSKGAEHGHAHPRQSKHLPWTLLISLCIHAFLEGIPLELQPNLLWGVSIHKIPIGLVVCVLLFQTKASTFSQWIALLVFALMSPLGSLTSLWIDIDFMNHYIEPFVAGILFHISTTILFESSEGHNFNLQKFIAILLGMGIVALL